MEIQAGTPAFVTHDIVVENQFAFRQGERVVVESISPNPQKPEYKYVVVSTALEKRFQLSDNDVTLVQQPVQQVPPQAPVQQAQVQEEQVQTTKPQPEATKASPVQPAPQAAGTGGQDSRVLGIGWLVLPLVLGLVLGILSYYAMTFVLGWTGVIAIIWALVRNSNIKKNGGEWKQYYKVSVAGWQKAMDYEANPLTKIGVRSWKVATVRNCLASMVNNALATYEKYW